MTILIRITNPYKYLVFRQRDSIEGEVMGKLFETIWANFSFMFFNHYEMLLLQYYVVQVVFDSMLAVIELHNMASIARCLSEVNASVGRKSCRYQPWVTRRINVSVTTIIEERKNYLFYLFFATEFLLKKSSVTTWKNLP